MKYRAYPEYRDSKMDWLGEYPAHWEIKKAGYLFTTKSGATPPDDPKYWDGGIPWVTPKDMKRPTIDSSEDTVSVAAIRDGLRLIKPPSILIVVRGMILAHSFPVAMTTVPVTINQDMKALDSPRDADPEFLSWALRGLSRPLLAGLVDEAAHGTKAIRMDRWHSFQLALPPIDEQRAIAGFVALKASKIGELISRKKRLISLLHEKRAAMITRAVTKGLDPNAPMKDSGVEWLGEIPASWQALRIRSVIQRIEQGWSPDCEAREADEYEWGVLKAGCVNLGYFNETEHKALPHTLQPRPQLEIRPGDLLMSRASGSPELVGSVAYVDACRRRLLLSDKIFRLVPDPSLMNSEFLAAAMNSRLIRAQVESALSGGKGLANNIPQSVARDLWVAAPPLEEQTSVATRLRALGKEAERLIARTTLGIDRLQEYRAALISAAVTGKIDVRVEGHSDQSVGRS